MPLTSLAGLKASALAWIERSGDPAAESIIDDCVTLCEARVNKTPDFRLSIMETEATLILVEGNAPLPFDFLGMKRVVAQSSIPRLLSYAEPGWFADACPSGADDSFGFYTIIGTTLRAKSASELGIVYYTKVPALTPLSTNWLLDRAPDVYLYGTIMELLNALEGDGMEKYAGLFGAALEGLIQGETYSRGGALTMRASMPAP